MDIKEFKSKNITELEKMVLEQREALRAMRFQVAQRQLKKVSDIQKTKKTISRLLTIIRQKRGEQTPFDSGPKS